MLFPALLSLAFSSSQRQRDHRSNDPLKHPRFIALELRELLPEIDETITISKIYFQALKKADADRVDEIVESIMMSILELRILLANSMTRNVIPLTQRIRSEIETIPKMLRYLMYHSEQPLKQREYAEIQRKYDMHISKDSYLRDILAFLRVYFPTRWKWAEELTIKTTSRVDDALSK